MNAIPQTFEEWRYCLIHNSKIDLTPAFAKQRLSIYNNPNDVKTKKFVEVYGQQHLQQIIQWFKRIEDEA